MSNIVVKACNLTKAYTLYPSQSDRLADLIGWSRVRRRSYPTHVAIDNLSFEIRAGEKVGFMGRNGAGKSTLLKLITGVIEPSSGRVEVSGKSHALLQIGAGFHQEFTGRQNAYAYLANLGVIGKRADELMDEIVDFTELEEYIDQPLRTYSTGMAMRLIFAASTAVAPSLFVIDELLGVGDAYFQGKSFARLEELCSERGTTLLLVSHEIYGAAKICNRMVWLDQGRIRFDGDARTALNFYENSIKEQEEQRLRRKAMLPSATARRRGQHWRSCLVELRPLRGKPLMTPVQLLQANLTEESRELDQGQFEFVIEGSNWNPEQVAGCVAEIKNVGSPFQKGIIRISAPTELILRSLVLSIQLVSIQQQELLALLYLEDGQPRKAGHVQLSPGITEGWKIPLDPLQSDLFREDETVPQRHGSGAIRFTSVDIVDHLGTPKRVLKQGEQITIEFRYAILDASAASDIEMVISIMRDGVHHAARAFNADLRLPHDQRAGIIRFVSPELPLASGAFVLSSIIAKRGYFEHHRGKPFSLNSDVYDVIARGLKFEVKPSSAVYQGTTLEWRGRWDVAPGIALPAELITEETV